MKTFAGDNGNWKFCLKCGNAKGTGHSKICKHFVDYEKKYKELRKDLKKVFQLGYSRGRSSVLVDLEIEHQKLLNKGLKGVPL